jgi:hypothetical protein
VFWDYLIFYSIFFDFIVSNILNPKERVPSPNLNVLKCTPSGSSSPIQMGVPLISPWKKSKVGCVIQPRPNEDFQRSLDLESYHFNKNPTSFKIGDGGVSFKEMTNKRKFLHGIKVCDDLYFSALIIFLF